MKERFDPREVYRYDPKQDLLYIDIALDYYREIYNEWDFSPQINRDLDEDLLEYLENCCAEIPARQNISICLNLPEAVYDPLREERSREGFRNYFTYLIRRQLRWSRIFSKKILLFLALGTFLMLCASLLEPLTNRTPQTRFLAEGILVGGWVCFWEVFSILFFRLSDHRQKVRTFRRLLAAQILFRYRPTAATDPLP
ncbi:MAG: hypothetical protein P8X63_00750 [Desulfuromonadaceae bacterium]